MVFGKWSITRRAANVGLGAGLLLVALAPSRAGDETLDARVAKGVKAWSDSNDVAVSDDVVKRLAAQANAAVADIAQRNTRTSKARLEEVAPKAVIAHLERSQSSGKAPDVEALVEQLATDASALLPSLTDFPTLKIIVVPPDPADFVVSIDGNDYRGGVTVFRVAVSAKHVVVSRAGQPMCDFSIKLKKGDVHTETCKRPA